MDLEVTEEEDTSMDSIFEDVTEDVVADNDNDFQDSFRALEEEDDHANETISKETVHTNKCNSPEVGIEPTESTESTDLPPHVNHTDVQELDAKVKSMMTKSQNIVHGRKADKCKSCGKEDTSTNMKFHIEANHLTGVSLPCNHCEKTFKTRNSWGRHKVKYDGSHRSKLRGRSFPSCNYCEKTFRFRQSLRNHIKIHK